MKIRTDFITNSSSSAFVIIGTNVTYDDYDKINDLADKNGLHFFTEDGVIGKIIANLDFESWGPFASMPFSEVQDAFNEVKNLFDKLGIIGEVKLIANIFEE